MSRFITPGIQDRTRGPAPGAAGDGLDGLYSGVLNSTPSGGTCLVVVPGLDPLHHIDVFCRADATGSVGDLVLVGFDENKLCFLVLNLGRSAL